MNLPLIYAYSVVHFELSLEVLKVTSPFSTNGMTNQNLR